jgi:hypothetical protein
MRESNTSIPGCAFDNCTTGLDQSKTLGILDDEEGGAILDGTTGILEFSFAEDIAARFFGESLKTDERSLANGCVV